MIPEPTPKRIRDVLELRKLTQKEAADLIGVAPTTMRRYLVTEGSSKLVMPANLWELLLLKTNTHPNLVVAPRDILGALPNPR